MKAKLLLFFFGIIFFYSCTSHDNDDSIHGNTQRITHDGDKHQAFTDLVFFDNQWFLSYRESDKHVYGIDGVVKILSSHDGVTWKLIKEYQSDNLDLSSAMFSVNGDKLMAYIHGSRYIEKKLVMFKDFKIDYIKGQGWNDLQTVILDESKGYTSNIEGNQAWPWRITWFGNKAYSVGYNGAEIFDLYQSDNGLFFKNIKPFSNITKLPTEAIVRISDEGVFYILARRNYGNAIIGKSDNPEGNWDWFDEIPIYNFGGPNFLLLDQKHLLIAGRELDKQIVGLYDLENKKYKKLVTLESGGDCSYPGMVIKDGFLWLSYYSSHENKKGSSIYVTKIQLKDFSL